MGVVKMCLILSFVVVNLIEAGVNIRERITTKSASNVFGMLNSVIKVCTLFTKWCCTSCLPDCVIASLQEESSIMRTWSLGLCRLRQLVVKGRVE